MEKILLLLHTEEDGSLSKPALEGIKTARGLACSLKESTWTVGIIGGSVEGAANSIASCGAGRFVGGARDVNASPRYASDAAAAEAICRSTEATLILAPATSRWNRTLAGVAQRIGGKVETHAVAVSASDGKTSVGRWYYRQRIETTLSRVTRPWMILLDSGAGNPWSGEVGQATLEPLSIEITDSLRRTTVTGVRAPEADEQTIRPDAPLLLVAGAGWTKKQSDGAVHADVASDLILGFIRSTQSSLGS
ncbi:MAG: electron transfer flavoprotein subunit alpha, partial [bacterium]|nr:electron transfer flavoprotein subunit alpha [bacterium]